MPDSTTETPKISQVPDLYYLTKAGISQEAAQEILDKKKLAAQNVEQARTAGSDLYERVSLGLPVSELNLGSGNLQLAMESPTTGNLTQIIKDGLAGLNPTPPEEEVLAIYDGIASKALKEKDFPAAVKALILANEDPNLEKPDVLKRLQDSTQGDVEEQLKLAQVLSELLPKKENAPATTEPSVNLESDPTPIKTKLPHIPTDFPNVEPTFPHLPSETETPTPTTTPTETPTRTFTPTETPTTTTTPTQTETPAPTSIATSTSNANETQIPEPATTPDLSGYALPQINAVPPTEVPATPLNLAGTRPLSAETTSTEPVDMFSATNANLTSKVEVSVDQTPPGMRPAPEQPKSITPIVEIDPDVKPSGIINKFPQISNPFRKAA